MAGNKRLSRDQKRKAKLKKRAERSRSHESLAYTGNKYKTDELTPVIFRTEVGIYEAYLMLDPDLTDDDVESAIEQMILQLREGKLSPLPEPGTQIPSIVGDEHFIIESIRRNWEDYAEEHVLPPKDDLIGILRTILSSLDIWRSRNMSPQGYFRFLKDFMKDVGVNVRVTKSGPRPIEDPTAGELPSPDGEEPE